MTSTTMMMFDKVEARRTFLDWRAQRRCDFVLRRLRLDNLVECECTADRELLGGKQVTVSCSQSDLVEAFCTPLFCGKASYSITYSNRGGILTNSICIETESVLPGDLPSFCIAAEPSDRYLLRFDTCSVEIENESCTCEVCESGRAFTIECANRPKVECLGLNFIGG